MPHKKIGIILQARTGSTRLPGKVLMKIQGKTVVNLIVERLKRIKNADEIILATGEDPKNDGLVEEAKRLGINYFRGSEENLLDRFYQAAQKFNLSVIVRITGDCPLIDPEVIEREIEFFKKAQVDIVSNTIKRTFPHGLDFEIFTKDALEQAWLAEKKRMQDDFEVAFVNPTAYIKGSKKFKHLDIIHATDLSDIRITLDYPEDFELIEKIYNELYPRNPNFGLQEILSLLNAKPQLLLLNKKYVKVN